VARTAGAERARLRADCERCAGLCCVAPAFSASADFAIDKAAGQPCPNLAADFRCAVHTRLRQEGFPGCASYDCFGAGQQVTQVTFGGQDWRKAPQIAAQLFAAFTVDAPAPRAALVPAEALTLRRARPIHHDLRLALDKTERLTRATPADLVDLDVAAHRREVNALLLQASELARADAPRHAIDHRGADLIGADLRALDLRGASLRGRISSGPTSGARTCASPTSSGPTSGAPTSPAPTSPGSIFLTQSQLDAAQGDTTTRVPPAIHRPAHWAVVRSR